MEDEPLLSSMEDEPHISSQGVCSSAQLDALEERLGAMQSREPSSPSIGSSLRTERSGPSTPEEHRPRKRMMAGTTPQTAARRGVQFGTDSSDVASAPDESQLSLTGPGETLAVSAPAAAASADDLTDRIVRMVGDDLKESLNHLTPTLEMLRHTRHLNRIHSECDTVRSECDTLDQTLEKQCLCGVSDVASTLKDFIQKDYPAEEDAVEFYRQLEPILFNLVCNVYPIRACWSAKNSDDDFVCEHHNMKFMEKHHLYAYPTYTDSGRCWREEDSEKVLRTKLLELYPDRSDACR